MSKFKLDPRRLLEIPLVYMGFQAVIGATSARKRLIQKKLPLLNGARILEVGCGLGNNLDHLPPPIDYVGCDISERYIRWAQKKYNGRAAFIKAGVGELTTKNLGSFDFIFSVGLLHHLSDSESQILFREILELLSEKGCFIAIEPCHSEKLSRLEQLINSKDRGKHIRFPKDYVQLLSRFFPRVETEYFQEGHIIPHSGLFMKAHKA